ncbi:MAG: PEP-CTERM sorting domain-containing protein [Planctomycetes bacterium]|nr:PEP-CTERM sorting domain-containing protein [Planctomycetota bacterium]
MRTRINLSLRYSTVCSVALGVGGFLTATQPLAASVVFSTFINGSDIQSATGQNSTISITYAGNKFVGGLYFGTGNNQLYQSNLTGGGVTTFGAPIPGASGEVVVGASLNRGGFGTGEIFAGSQAGTQIYHFQNDGSGQSLFTTLPTGGDIRQIFFDPGNSFGGKMIVTTASGDIYTVNSSGTATLLASIGEDTEGLDIAPSSWGPFAGQLLVASEGSGALRFVSNAGVVTNSGIAIPAAETVSFVPANLGLSGNPLEGFYVANYPVDIQKAGASQFAGLQNHAIVTSEDGGNARVWDLIFNGTNLVNNGVVGNLPNQSEDGIFVTAERINDVTVPEPGSLTLLSLGLLTVAGMTCWQKRQTAPLL